VIKARLPLGLALVSEQEVWLQLINDHTCFYRDEVLLP